MSLPKEFWEQLPRRTNAQLVDMLARRGEYEPDAVLAAEAELKKREMTPEKLVQVAEVAQAEDSAARESRANESLGWLVIFLVLFPCPGPMLGIVMYVQFTKEGYTRKANQCAQAAAVGLALYYVLHSVESFFRGT